MKLISHKTLIRHRRTLFSLLTSHFSLPRLCAYKSFMQNEPNFQKTASTLSAVIAATYNEKPLVNPKITNPIEPNTNPIGKRPKINPNSCHNRELQRKTSFAPKNNEPKRTQSQPNTNPKTNPIFPTRLLQQKSSNQPGEKVKKLAINLYIAIITGVTTDGRGAKILDCNDSFANIGVQRLNYGRT